MKRDFFKKLLESTALGLEEALIKVNDKSEQSKILNEEAQSRIELISKILSGKIYTILNPEMFDSDIQVCELRGTSYDKHGDPVEWTLIIDDRKDLNLRYQTTLIFKDHLFRDHKKEYMMWVDSNSFGVCTNDAHGATLKDIRQYNEYLNNSCGISIRDLLDSNLITNEEYNVVKDNGYKYVKKNEIIKENINKCI